MTKSEIRKLYLQKRLSLSAAEYEQLNRSLCEAFFSCIDLSSVNVLHTFLPIEKKHEPDTWCIIERLQREFPAIRIAIPRVNKETSHIDSFYYEGRHQLVVDRWGIPEPKEGIPTPQEKIDMVLVPLLAYDKNGHRVGYGGGFYDKFLAECKTGCKKVGLSFFPPLDFLLPSEAYDITIDCIVTPDGVLTVPVKP